MGMSKNDNFQFHEKQNSFFSNLNTANLKMCPSHDGIYRFGTKFNKNSRERRGLCKNVRGCNPEINPEVLRR